LARYTLIVLTVINLLNYLDRWIIAAVAPRIQEALGLSNTQLGAVMSAFMLGYFITSPFFGWASDKYSRKFLVAGGVFVWCFATMGSGWATTFGALIAMRVFVGFGEASYAAASPTILTDLYPTEKRNTVVSWFQAAVPIGAALGFLAGGYLEAHYGWRWAFYIAGVPGLITVAALLFVREPQRGAAETRDELARYSAHAQHSIIKRTLREFIGNPIYRNAVFGYTAYSFTLGGFASWCPKYAVAVRGMELSRANYLIGIITVVAGVGGTLVGGAWASRLLARFGKTGPVKLMVGSSLLATPFAFSAFFTPTPTGFFAALAVTQFVLFMGHSPVNVVIVEAVPFYIRATALALTTFIIHILGDLISPPLVGYIADIKNLQTGILVLPAALIVCTWFWWRTHQAIRA